MLGKLQWHCSSLGLEIPNCRKILVPILPATPGGAQFADGKWHEVTTTADLYCFVLFVNRIAESSKLLKQSSFPLIFMYLHLFCNQVSNQSSY